MRETEDSWRRVAECPGTLKPAEAKNGTKNFACVIGVFIR